MIQTPSANRRRVLAGLATLAVAAPTAARAQSTLDATTLGVVADTGADQTAAIQSALDTAAASGQSLRLPGGTMIVRNIALPSNIIVEGVPGSTELASASGPVATIYDRGSVVLRDLSFTGSGLDTETPSLLTIEASDAAIHSMDSRGLLIVGNRIDYCGNAGIRIWRSEPGADGSIITANRIDTIDWRDGGNGQNGNGINVFRADEVIVSDNHIADCAFSAVRLNSTKNSQVSGNTCLRSRECAIFSEFDFSGSVIANNIVDGAASGISMTNLDQGGQLSVCSGNIVRNITPVSPVNPDSGPVGIAAEANAAITGNTVQGVPGIAISAGYGPYLRNVLIASNVISECNIGIAVSVAPDAGPVHIANNMIYQPLEYAVIGKAWQDIIEPDLLANADKYPNVTIG